VQAVTITIEVHIEGLEKIEDIQRILRWLKQYRFPYTCKLYFYSGTVYVYKPTVKKAKEAEE